MQHVGHSLDTVNTQFKNICAVVNKRLFPCSAWNSNDCQWGMKSPSISGSFSEKGRVFLWLWICHVCSWGNAEKLNVSGRWKAWKYIYTLFSFAQRIPAQIFSRAQPLSPLWLCCLPGHDRLFQREIELGVGQQKPQHPNTSPCSFMDSPKYVSKGIRHSGGDGWRHGWMAGTWVSPIFLKVEPPDRYLSNKIRSSFNK